MEALSSRLYVDFTRFRVNPRNNEDESGEQFRSFRFLKVFQTQSLRKYPRQPVDDAPRLSAVWEAKPPKFGRTCLVAVHSGRFRPAVQVAQLS